MIFPSPSSLLRRSFFDKQTDHAKRDDDPGAIQASSPRFAREDPKRTAFVPLILFSDPTQRGGETCQHATP